MRIACTVAIALLIQTCGYLAAKFHGHETAILFSFFLPLTLLGLLILMRETHVKHAKHHVSGEPLSLPESLQEGESVHVIKVLPHLRNVDVTDFYIIGMTPEGRKLFYYVPHLAVETAPHEGRGFHRVNGKMLREKSLVEKYQELQRR